MKQRLYTEAHIQWSFLHFVILSFFFFLQVAFKNNHDQHVLESQFSCSFLLLGGLYIMPQMWGCHREHYHEQFNSLRSVAQNNLVILTHTFFNTKSDFVPLRIINYTVSSIDNLFLAVPAYKIFALVRTKKIRENILQHFHTYIAYNKIILILGITLDNMVKWIIKLSQSHSKTLSNFSFILVATMTIQKLWCKYYFLQYYHKMPHDKTTTKIMSWGKKICVQGMTAWPRITA